VGEELFALPLPTVEGVVRVPRSEVLKHLGEEAASFDYGGQKYRFQHLANFVGGTPASMPEHDTAVPVILVRAGEHSTAVVTDELIGSREIVVKTVGPQISGIRGISGATILGDGRICVILDVGALVRSEWRQRATPDPRIAGQVDRRVFALVVDDSITVRLPFTLAISQALVVRVGEELFALPLPTVEGVVRVPRSEVLKHLGEEAASFDYGGQKYRFQHLANFVGGTPASMPEHDTAVPVILVRAGEHSTAVVTDELIGSREIVVKTVGPQISGIRGISGATILGDGRICVILDVGALVRSEWRQRATPDPRIAGQVDRRVFALVVDDSITVRRVTQRLLERNGMRVMTAKDGLEAVSVLQDEVPDVILLDIEMPRMDGYEVASHVRNDSRLRDIPIVMITSRVGEKHRARAIELGVNEYIGKPYQEGQLLQAIEPLVRRRAS
jgi:chemotaxis protein histidine kinase CheA